MERRSEVVGGGVVSYLNSLIVEEGVNSCIASFIVCFVHFYPEASPVCREHLQPHKHFLQYTPYFHI